MDSGEFTHHPKVERLITQLKEDQIDEKIFSDVIDEKGHQYVDLVQEGGGVLGFALVGYTYVLEQMGIRFLNLAGTSAGAVNALFLNVMGDFQASKSELLIDEFARKNIMDFVDNDATIKNILKTIVKKEGIAKSLVHVIWNGFRLKRSLNKNLGVNSGTEFYQWVDRILKKHDISTTADLFQKQAKLPETLRIRENVERNVEGLHSSIAIITADITTQTKVSFPQMNFLYWHEPDKVNPADYIRASMAIPFLFQPYEVSNLPKGYEAQTNWRNMVRYNGPIPEKVRFVDGGVMSNFPIDAFHITGVPRVPTFGVKLGVNRENPELSSNLRSYLKNLINAMRQVHDFEFLVNNHEYEKLIQTVDIGDHIWFDFDISNDDKIDLFICGAKAANAFLRRFDWPRYKQLRYEKLLNSNG